VSRYLAQRQAAQLTECELVIYRGGESCGVVSHGREVFAQNALFRAGISNLGAKVNDIN
jgi:hypothetical protein